MRVSLVVMNPGKTAGHAIPITLPQFIIGRDPQCNLRPASPVISKRHCAILVKNGKVTVRDFDSTNGTFIDDAPVKGEVPLNHDNILKVGPLTFKVVIEKTVGVDKPTPRPPKKNPGSDEDVANMLLALQENGPEEEIANAEADEEEIANADADEEEITNAEADEEVTDAESDGEEITSAEADEEENFTSDSTVTEMPAMPANSLAEPEWRRPGTPPPPTTEPQPAEAKKPEQKKPSELGSARDAAKAILEKYAKRSRGGG
jgi:pSer/pThr/pTyr-binding forkhead associated (FHA) protein